MSKATITITLLIERLDNLLYGNQEYLDLAGDPREDAIVIWATYEDGVMMLADPNTLVGPNGAVLRPGRAGDSNLYHLSRRVPDPGNNPRDAIYELRTLFTNDEQSSLTETTTMIYDPKNQNSYCAKTLLLAAVL